MEQFKGSMDAPQKIDNAEKKVITPIDVNVKVKKPSKFGGVFRILFSKDIFSAMKDALFDVAVPNIRDTAAKTSKNVIDQMFYDIPPKGKGYNSIDYGTTSYTAYNTYSQRQGAITVTSQGAQVRANRKGIFDINEIIFRDNPNSDKPAIVQVREVIEQLQSFCHRFGFATVLDFYEIAKVPSDNYLNDRYGWYNLDGLDFGRVRDGYVINFPRPQIIDVK